MVLQERDGHPDEEIKNGKKQEAETDNPGFAGKLQIVIVCMVNVQVDELRLKGA